MRKIKKIETKSFIEVYSEYVDKFDNDVGTSIKTLDLSELYDRVVQAQQYLKTPEPNMLIAGELMCIQSKLDKLKNEFLEKVFLTNEKEK